LAFLRACLSYVRPKVPSARKIVYREMEVVIR
jgi:hypothetical protein